MVDDPISILLVDGDGAFTSLMQYGLEKHGYSVHIESDGHAALEYLRQHRVDVLLTEIVLPQLDGFRLLQAAGELAADDLVVKIVMSERFSEEDIERALSLGAFDYFSKPVSLALLLARIGRCMRCKSPEHTPPPVSNTSGIPSK